MSGDPTVLFIKCVKGDGGSVRRDATGAGWTGGSFSPAGVVISVKLRVLK